MQGELEHELLRIDNTVRSVACSEPAFVRVISNVLTTRVCSYSCRPSVAMRFLAIPLINWGKRTLSFIEDSSWTPTDSAVSWGFAQASSTCLYWWRSIISIWSEQATTMAKMCSDWYASSWNRSWHTSKMIWRGCSWTTSSTNSILSRSWRIQMPHGHALIPQRR